MGQAKIKREHQNGHAPAGNTGFLLRKKRVKIVNGVLLQNDTANGVGILMMGETSDRPEIGNAMTPSEMRRMADALLQHASQLEKLKQDPEAPPGPTLFGPGGYPLPPSGGQDPRG